MAEVKFVESVLELMYVIQIMNNSYGKTQVLAMFTDGNRRYLWFTNKDSKALSELVVGKPQKIKFRVDNVIGSDYKINYVSKSKNC